MKQIDFYATKAYGTKERYSFKSLLGEIFEVFEAIFKLDWVNTKAEIAQVLLMLQLMLWQRTRIKTPITNFTKPVVLEHISRIRWFKKKFHSIGVPFKLEYLRRGSNYRNKRKVALAFCAAANDLAGSRKKLSKKL